MIERNYILLFDYDLISHSILTFSIQILKAHSHNYQVEVYQTVCNLLESIALEEDNYHKKGTVKVDTNMEQNKEFLFLDSLQE